MTPPDPHSITVATDALRRDASLWDDQSCAMRDIAARAESLRLNRIQAGLFQVVFDAYTTVIDQVVARSREGSDRMGAIRDTLHATADTYDREETQRLHALRNLY